MEHRSRVTKQSHQVRPAAESTTDVQSRVNKSDRGVRRGHPKITGQRKLRSATPCQSIDGGDDGHGEIAHLIERTARQVEQLDRLFGAAYLSELSEVTAGRKGLVALTGHDCGLQREIHCILRTGFAQLR